MYAKDEFAGVVEAVPDLNSVADEPLKTWWMVEGSWGAPDAWLTCTTGA